MWPFQCHISDVLKDLAYAMPIYKLCKAGQLLVPFLQS